MQASTLIKRALRLINVPGRGATLGSQDEDDAFEVFQDMLNAESVGRYFQPGIRRHFFLLPADKDIYTYGPGGDFDTDLFEDPVPTQIEDAYIRLGSTIVDNELVTNHLFQSANGWTLGAGWVIQNGEAIASAATTALEQAIVTEIGQTYQILIRGVELNAESLQVDIDTFSESIIASGDFEFTFTATVINPTLTLTGIIGFEGSLDSVSIRNVNATERSELVGRGSDYKVEVIDQKHYNHRFSKGTGGRPYELLFSRSWPLAEIRFDNAPSTGDKLVMDVTVNRIALERKTDDIRLYPDAERFLRYQLAYEMAPEYGKQLSASALRTLNRSRQQLQASNNRPNALRVDGALRNRRSFDVNRGDP